MTESIKEKIRKLLTLASSTNNPGEADVAFTKAQLLMDLHRIERCDIEEEKEPYIKEEDPIVEGKRIPRWKIDLGIVIATYNNCYAVLYKGFFGTRLILFGRKEDIEHVRWVFGYCVVQLNTYASVGCIGHDRSFKSSWLVGAVAGIRAKLAEGRRMAASQSGDVNTGLVKLNDEFNKVKAFANSLDLITSSRAKTSSIDSNAYNSGFKTGKNVDIGQHKLKPNIRGTLGG
jgi:hypothetical protein